VSFPDLRMRRLRRTPAMRNIMQKVKLHPSNLVYPIFVDENAKTPIPIKAMPGYYRLPIQSVVDEVGQTVEQGIKAVILFGIPSKKDETGSSAFAEDGGVQEAIRKLKKEFGGELVVMADVCLCEYTTHGHCGVVKDGEVVQHADGRTMWLNVQTTEQVKIDDEIKRKFKEYWTVEYENYPVTDHYLKISDPITIKADV